MEKYTVDLAQLGNVEGGARPVGFEQAFHDRRTKDQKSQKLQDAVDIDDEEDDQEHDGVRDEDEDQTQNEDGANDFMDGYEVDLGGFGDKPSSVLVEDVVHPREGAPSEDEGPEDFTQNLEAWMRGTKKGKREQIEDIAEGHEPNPDPERHPREAMVWNEIAEESVFEPLGSFTPASLKNHANIGQGVEEESMLQAPPLSRMDTEMLQDRTAEEVFDRISALQAEVESMRMEDEARRAAHKALKEEHEKMRNEYESIRMDDRKRYDALRLEHDQLQRAHLGAKEALRRENKDLTMKYNNVMEQLRVLENQATLDRGTKVKTLGAIYEPAVQELEALKAQAKLDKNAAHSQIETLSRELKASRDGSSRYKSQIDLIQETNSITVKNLEVELEARNKEVALERKESIDRANEAVSLAESNQGKDKEVSELVGEVEAIKMQIRHAQEQLRETQRIVETVEEDNDRLVQQNQRQAENVAELEAILKGRETADATSAPIADRQTTIDKATHKALLEALSHQHQSTLTSLGADHGKEIQTLRKALLKESEGMQKREAKLEKTRKDQVASHNQQVPTLMQQQAKALESSNAMEKKLRSAIRVLSAKLERVNASTESARLKAEEARQQAEDAQQANAIVNAELESRFVKTIESREKEWRRRIDLLLRERERLGKALMWGWGREELGPKAAVDREQGYRYKFSKKI